MEDDADSGLLWHGFLVVEWGLGFGGFAVIALTWLTCSNCDVSFVVAYHRVCNESNTTGVTSVTGTAYPSGASEFTPSF